MRKPFWKRSIRVILIWGIAFPLFATWQSDYKKGLYHFKREAYGKAILFFTRAIGKNPKDCRQCLREGMYFEDYTPHLFLAKALVYQGNTEKAKQVIQKALNHPFYKKHKKYHDELENYLAQLMSEEEATEEKAEVAPVSPPTTPPSKPGVDTTFIKEKGALQEKIQTLLLRWEEKKEKVHRPFIRRKIERFIHQLTLLQKQVEAAQHKESLQPLEDQLNELRKNQPSLEPPPQPPPKPLPKPQPPQEKPELEHLRSAYQFFFLGNYPKAEEQLQLAIQKGYTGCFAPLLEGCLTYTRYLLSGEREEALVHKAEELFKKARLHGCLEDILDEKLFSPRLIAFYQNLP